MPLAYDAATVIVGSAEELVHLAEELVEAAEVGGANFELATPDGVGTFRLRREDHPWADPGDES